MPDHKRILAIIGSASESSANEKLVQHFTSLVQDRLEVTVFKDLKALPHFDPLLSVDNPPESIVAFREAVRNADGIVICTPEYIFSIPAGLKNAIEWCVSTTIFNDKPAGLITASAQGIKGHEALQLIMKTVMARFTEDTLLLIQGIKGKIDEAGKVNDKETAEQLAQFAAAFQKLVFA